MWQMQSGKRLCRVENDGICIFDPCSSSDSLVWSTVRVMIGSSNYALFTKYTLLTPSGLNS
jgi:hypothetical protein